MTKEELPLDLEMSRAERLAQIRRQIEQGTYETPSRLEGAVEGLLLDLELRSQVSTTDDNPPSSNSSSRPKPR